MILSFTAATVLFLWSGNLVSCFTAVPWKVARSSSSLYAIQGSGVGVSNNESTEQAVQEAVSQALQGCAEPASYYMAFCSTTVARDVEQVRAAFRSALPAHTRVHGITSSAALLRPGKGSTPNSVGCLILSCSDEADFATAYDPENASRAAAALLQQMPRPQAIFMGATPGAEEGVLNVLAELFPGVPVFGGTAADDDLSGAWMVWGDDGVASGTGVSLVGVGPTVSFSASMIGPYTPTSTTVVATRSEGRRVYQLDGKPAADWVHEWLGNEVKEQYENGGLVLPQTAQKPIAVRTPQGEYVTAHCAAFSGSNPPEGDGRSYVDFFAPIPQGATLTVMDSGNGPSTGYASALSQTYATSVEGLKSGISPKGGLLVYCGGMAIAVGDNLDSGLTSLQFSAQTKELPCLGMTCFGEQACLPESRTNAQRNLSVGMILFG